MVSQHIIDRQTKMMHNSQQQQFVIIIFLLIDY